MIYIIYIYNGVYKQLNICASCVYSCYSCALLMEFFWTTTLTALQVSDHGLRQLNDIGVLERLTARACQALTDEGGPVIAC